MSDVNNELLRQFQEEAHAAPADETATDASGDQADHSSEEGSQDAPEAEAHLDTADESDSSDTATAEETPEAYDAPYDQESPESDLPADDLYSDVRPEQLVEAARDYPVDAFRFAAENMPNALPGVLSEVNQKDLPLSYGLLLGWVDERVGRAVSEALQPVYSRNAQADAHSNAHTALTAVSQRIEDAQSLAEEAAKVVQERQGKLAGHSQKDLEEFFQDAYDIARGRLAASGKAPAKQDPPKKTEQAPPVLGQDAAGDEGAPDAWAQMEKFRHALGV